MLTTYFVIYNISNQKEPPAFAFVSACIFISKSRYYSKAREHREADELLRKEIREYIVSGTTGEGIRNDFETRKEKLQKDSKRFTDKIEGVSTKLLLKQKHPWKHYTGESLIKAIKK